MKGNVGAVWVLNKPSDSGASLSSAQDSKYLEEMTKSYTVYFSFV
jgi:hypothetical protein